MNEEHFHKYDELAHKLGWNAVLALVPVNLETIRAALDEGDEHLNIIPLATWDHAAKPRQVKAQCQCCGTWVWPKNTNPKLGCAGPMRDLFDKAKLNHSLSDGICVLKHVAIVEALKLEV